MCICSRTLRTATCTLVQRPVPAHAAQSDSAHVVHEAGTCMCMRKHMRARLFLVPPPPPRPPCRGVQLRGMDQDLSWDNAAQQYEAVLLAAKYQW